MWVLVELETIADYGYGGEYYDRHEIGETVWGPFETEHDAEAYGRKLNDERGWYDYGSPLGGPVRRYRQVLRDFEAREVTAPCSA